MADREALTRESDPGRLPRAGQFERVYCTHGDPVGGYPEAIALLLSEDEVVAIHELLVENGQHGELAQKVRFFQLDAWARWHG